MKELSKIKKRSRSLSKTSYLKMSKMSASKEMFSIHLDE